MKRKNMPVIFIDLGGTYFTNPRPFVRKFAKKFGIPAEKMEEAIWGKKTWTPYATGKSSDNTYWKKVAKELGISEGQKNDLRKACYASIVPQYGMKSLVRGLKKKYRVVILSSHIKGWVSDLNRKYNLPKEFHGHHYSYDHGVDKPDVKLFLLAARKMKAAPENCIVVDDNKAFIAAVKKTGAMTILFKDANDTKARLRKIGVEI
jgi:putative hydrolase of the HAD superfamily